MLIFKLNLHFNNENYQHFMYNSLVLIHHQVSHNYYTLYFILAVATHWTGHVYYFQYNFVILNTHAKIIIHFVRVTNEHAMSPGTQITLLHFKRLRAEKHLRINQFAIYIDFSFFFFILIPITRAYTMPKLAPLKLYYI